MQLYEQIEKSFFEHFERYGVSIEEDEDMFKFESPEPSVILSFLKQFFIKYLQDEVERLEKTVQKDPYELEIIPEEDKGKITDVMLRNGVKMLKNQDGKEFRWGYNQAISDQITYITNQIKELEV